MTACKMMRRWRELRATMVTFAFFVAQHMKIWANEVFCMPVICHDKVGLGIARRYIGKRSAWIEIDAHWCDHDAMLACPCQKAGASEMTRVPPFNHSHIFFADYCSVSLVVLISTKSELTRTHFLQVPKFAALLRQGNAA